MRKTILPAVAATLLTLAGIGNAGAQTVEPTQASVCVSDDAPPPVEVPDQNNGDLPEPPDVGDLPSTDDAAEGADGAGVDPCATPAADDAVPVDATATGEDVPDPNGTGSDADPEAPEVSDGTLADAPEATDTEVADAPEATDTEVTDAPEATDTEVTDAPEATDTEVADAPEATDTEVADAPEATDTEVADAAVYAADAGVGHDDAGVPIYTTADSEDDEDDNAELFSASNSGSGGSGGGSATPSGGAFAGAGGTAPTGSDVTPLAIVGAIGLAVMTAGMAARRRSVVDVDGTTDQH